MQKPYNPEAYSRFIHLVNIWWRGLEQMMKDIIARGNKPVLIALSRKMPRFMDWFRENFPKLVGARLDLSILDKAELTTELAIPFIWINGETDNLEFIILDDIIIHGTSLRSVASDLHFLTGKKSHVSCIMRLKDADGGDFISDKEYGYISQVSVLEAYPLIDIIADIVEKSELPIDMEFPIFSIECKNDAFAGSVFSMIKSNLEEDGVMVYDIGKNGDRFSSNIPYSRIPGRNNDFAKLRFFYKGDRVVFESISPMLFSQSELTSLDSDIFHNSLYANIWNLTTVFIRGFLRNFRPEKNFLGWEKLKVSFHRSLCVWASYLYSLSAYSMNAESFLPPAISHKDVRLSYKDLRFVLGQSQVNMIEYLLNLAVRNLSYDTSLKSKVVSLPVSFSPSAFSDDLGTLRVRAALASDNAAQVCRIIFSFQHFANPQFSNEFLYLERLFFGETYDSLVDSCEPFVSGPHLSTDIHQWIDESIDAGYVIPKYESVKDKDGSIYWRRYFHAGIRKMRNKK